MGVLAAEALMLITPWKLWDLNSGMVAAPPARTDDARALLQRASALQFDHPGSCHAMIHLMEMSPTPEMALPYCEALVANASDTGHLTHMPSHIYLLCGEYEEAVHWNHVAAVADQRYLNLFGKDAYTFYCVHNLHSKLYAAMFSGNYLDAICAVDAIEGL